MDRRTFLKNLSAAATGTTLGIPVFGQTIDTPYPIRGADASERDLLEDLIPYDEVFPQIVGIGPKGARLVRQWDRHNSLLGAELAVIDDPRRDGWMLSAFDYAPFVVTISGFDTPDERALCREFMHQTSKAGSTVYLTLVPDTTRQELLRRDPRLAEAGETQGTNARRIIPIAGGNDAVIDCLRGLSGALLGTSQLCGLDVADVQSALRGDGLAAFGFGLASGSPKTRGSLALQAAIRKLGDPTLTNDSSTWMVTLEGNDRTLNLGDVLDVFRAIPLLTNGHKHLAVGTAVNNTLPDGTLGVGIIATL